MRRLAVLLFVLFAAPALAQGFDHSHRAWDVLLKSHVVIVEQGRASQTDYAGMARERAALNSYLGGLSGVTEAEFGGWSRSRRMAFLINAYNAFTVEKILTRYPDLKSIWDFGRIFGNPFKDDFFKLFGRDSSLDRIEQEMLRKPGAYDEPRVHFALNCASVGCPMLREEAYVAERLEQQLEEQARRFLSDRTRNRVSARGALEVSKVFDWYQEDFGPRERYFARYAKLLADEPGQQKLVAEGKAPISFLEYDWALNDARKR